MASVDVVVPVYNEEKALPRSIPALQQFLAGPSFAHEWRIIIGDNASTDGTPNVGRRLEDSSAGKIEYVRIERKGRGFALKQIWGTSRADIVSYMDVDLSTGLDAFPALIDAIAEGRGDIAIGSRLKAGSRVTRSVRRRVLTRGYNSLIRLMFGARFSDAQCGFKAASRKAARQILPLVEDNNWFFDTEFLILSEKRGYRISEVPVEWVEDTDTRVKIAATVREDLRGLLRMWVNRPWKRAKAKAEQAP